MDKHRSDFKRWKNEKARFVSSFSLFDKYGIENCQIVLLENCQVDTKDELFIRERHFIKSTQCVNKLSPIHTKEDKQLSDKNYREKNIDKIHEFKNKKTQCPCSGSYTHCHQSLHFRTNKHKNYIANNPINLEIPIDV